ncbi:DNA polymerase [Micromonospora chokoriensis]
MITLTHVVAGETCTIRYPERPADLYDFEGFVAGPDKVLAIDTETTGLDIYTPGHRLRLVQFGNAREAWVLRADLFGVHIKRALARPRSYVAHNWTYDALVLDHHLGVKLEELGARSYDTRILAHLLDPRTTAEGGVGLGLKPLSAVYTDPEAPDTQDGLTAEFRRLGFTKATGWAGIPIDNELYVRYAGLDVILTHRLFHEIAPTVRDVGLDHLSKFEHHLQVLLAILQRRGMRLDVPYVERLRGDLLDEAEKFKAVAARYGVTNVNSTAQVAAALEAMGETLTETTPSGAAKVDKNVLLPLADLNLQWERVEARSPNPLAEAVLRSKRAEKWAVTYAQAFLDLRDADDRLHPSIGALQARTARMSVSRPPLQQLPSSDWTIRRAFIADPGQLIVAADYKQVEMRVLAALSGDAAMLKAIADGLDIHDAVATGMFGPGFTKAQRKLAKNTGFGEVFGGGAITLARQAGVSVEVAKQAKALFAQGFPGIKRYGRRLINRAEYGRKEVITPSGRHLPLDRDRLYAATNYVVQSTARDLLAQAVVDVFDAGLGDHLLLPIHDELLAQAPAAEAGDVIREIGRVMESTFQGVAIASDPEVVGPSWGHGYGAPE